MPWKRDRVTEPDATIHLITLGVDHVGPHKARSRSETTPRVPNVYVVLFDDNARTNTPFKSCRVYIKDAFKTDAKVTF